MPLTLIKSDRKAREKPCLRCQLSLRKHPDARYCPQCGLSVWLSLNSNDSLDVSNPPWLAKIAAGAWAMVGAQCIGIAAGASYFIGQFNSLFYVLAGIYLLAHHAGLLIVALPEKRYPDLLRAQRIAVWIVSPIAMLVGGMLIPKSLRGDPLDFGGLLKIIFFASAIVTWLYFRPLAKRIPNSFLARMCGYILLAPVLTFVKSFPILSIFLASSIFGVLDFLPLVYVPVSLFMLVKFALAFGKASVSAAKSWAAETKLPETTQAKV